MPLKAKSTIIIIIVVFFYNCTNNAKTLNTLFPKTRTLANTENIKKENFWIFILAGQSNMAGRAMVEPSDTVENKRILSLDEDFKWCYAKDPLHFYEPKRMGTGPGLTFARELIKNLPDSITIGLVPCAYGGTTINNWLGNQDINGLNLLDNLKDRIDESSEYGLIKGMLWHQGESDANTNGVRFYESNLTNLFNLVQGFVNRDDFEIITSEIGPFYKHSSQKAYKTYINEMINNCAQKDDRVHIVKLDEYSHLGDRLHFDTKTQRNLGIKFSEFYLNLISDESIDETGILESEHEIFE